MMMMNDDYGQHVQQRKAVYSCFYLTALTSLPAVVVFELQPSVSSSLSASGSAHEVFSEPRVQPGVQRHTRLPGRKKKTKTSTKRVH